MDNAVLSKRDTYQTITEKIVAAIEAGVAEYRMPRHLHGWGLRPPSSTARRIRKKDVARRAAAIPSRLRWSMLKLSRRQQ
jgi:hypothetical protein